MFQYNKYTAHESFWDKLHAWQIANQIEAVVMKHMRNMEIHRDMSELFFQILKKLFLLFLSEMSYKSGLIIIEHLLFFRDLLKISVWTAGFLIWVNFTLAHLRYLTSN